MRGQDPYSGPSGGALAVMYGGAWIIAVSVVNQRATSSISGRSFKRRRDFRAGYFRGHDRRLRLALGSLPRWREPRDRVRNLPGDRALVFRGAVFATIAVVREEWRMMAFGIAAIAVATSGAFAGPIAAWLVTGIALAAFLVGLATVQIS